MRILITGGAGFIGSNLADYHLTQHHDVHIIDDLSTGSEENITRFNANPNFRFTKADLLSYPDFDAVVGWADRIYHMAALVGVLKVIESPERVLTVNIGITERLLRAATLSKRNPRLMLASTSEVYGEGDSHAFNEQSHISIGSGKSSCQSYIVSKIATESYGLAYYKQYGLAVTNLRIFNTIGPGQIGGYGMVVPRFIQHAIHNRPIMVHGSGQQIRSFCDVRDLIALMDCLADNPATFGEVVNLGHDQAISILDLALLTKQLAQSSSPIEHVAYEKIYGEGFEDIMFRKPDITHLLQLTDYHFKWNLETTLIDLIRRATC
ncbi:MAG: NAD-dependent epimerase/dehydratase family protein [Gammaproteobacteria bacterium]|nr:NAD-dependent epimerase/dehydratase family protein [Gammaproteobacteria bacterium]